MKIPHHKQSKKAPNTEIINSLDYSYLYMHRLCGRLAYLDFFFGAGSFFFFFR